MKLDLPCLVAILGNAHLDEGDPQLKTSQFVSEMGVKAKKALKKKLENASAQFTLTDPKTSASDFLPLKGGPACKLPVEKLLESKATVLYIGRIPHGFYENEMQAYFQQFGTIKRLRIARNKKVEVKIEEIKSKWVEMTKTIKKKFNSIISPFSNYPLKQITW